MVIDMEVDEMKRTVKTPADALTMALNEAAKTKKGEYLSVADILEKDNEIRKVYGLKEIDGYPVLEMEYSPSTQQSVWKRLVGAKIIRKPGRIPYAEAIYEEAENHDPAKRLSEINPIVNKKIEEDYPGTNFTKQERKPIEMYTRLSVIKKMQLKAGTGKDTPIPDYEEADEAPVVEVEKKKPGRPKKEA